MPEPEYKYAVAKKGHVGIIHKFPTKKEAEQYAKWWRRVYKDLEVRKLL